METLRWCSCNRRHPLRNLIQPLPRAATGLILTPFASLTAARIQPEIYREMLMNVFLFFPLGLTLSNALPRKWHRWLRIILTTLIGCALSAGIEYAQYRYALGLAETDDVICNTLGGGFSALRRCLPLTPSKNTKKGFDTRT